MTAQRSAPSDTAECAHTIGPCHTTRAGQVEDRWDDIGEHPWPLDFVVHLCGVLRLDEKQTSETLHDYVKKYGRG